MLQVVCKGSRCLVTISLSLLLLLVVVVVVLVGQRQQADGAGQAAFLLLDFCSSTSKRIRTSLVVMSTTVTTSRGTVVIIRAKLIVGVEGYPAAGERVFLSLR